MPRLSFQMLMEPLPNPTFLDMYSQWVCFYSFYQLTFCTLVGKDWTHAGVANLYTNISKNGYHFLYLTSRAIGQAEYTREYLQKVEQDTLKLPEGPVLLSPDRLVQAFTREVIQRRPQEFKMQCLKDVKRLFSGEKQNSPFYAGFGNRITDAMSYRSVVCIYLVFYCICRKSRRLESLLLILLVKLNWNCWLISLLRMSN